MVEIPSIRTAVLYVNMCVCVGFPLRPHSLSPCVILVSRSHGRCDIPTPVERIMPGALCVCLCVCFCSMCARGHACCLKRLECLPLVLMLYLLMVVFGPFSRYAESDTWRIQLFSSH